MQKKIIALAVAGLMSGAAFAQTNVTIYGVADAGYMHLSASGKGSQNDIDASGLSGSRLGFKGTEDLGNGNKALFVLEYSLANDNNSGVGSTSAWSGTAARQQLVGMTGGWGTVVAGRAETAGYAIACKYEDGIGAGSAFNATGKLQAKWSGATAIGCGSNGRANNAVAYVTPTWSGFHGTIQHARLTETATATIVSPNDNNATILAGFYDNGPISVGLDYTHINVPVLSTNINEWKLGASYDFGIAKLMGSYQRHNLTAVSNSDHLWNLAVNFAVSANDNISLGYARGTYNETVAHDDARAWGLTYAHNLSKRTRLYAGYAHISNDGIGTLGLGAATLAAGVGVPTAGGSASVYGGGLNHAF